MQERDYQIYSQPAPNEKALRTGLLELLKTSPIPDDQILDALALYMPRQSLARLLFFHGLYQKIIPINGSIMELGCRWGNTSALLASLRGIYEPYHHTRKIVSFDTFSGFPSVSKEDNPGGGGGIVKEGSFAVCEHYEEHLEKVLEFHNANAPVPHIKKYEIVKGDAVKTVADYLQKHPETIIAFAYFDFDLYEPTVECLKLILPYLTRGAIVGFDELNLRAFQGETIAFREIFGNNYVLHRDPIVPLPSYIVF